MSKLVHSTASRHQDHPRLDFARDLPMSILGNFTVAIAGDIVITRPISQLRNPLVAAAIEPFQRADLAIGNLEQTIADRRNFQGGAYGVPSFQIMADPSVAQDLARMGFSMLARANNRLSDFGAEGNRETDAHLRKAGITPVGFGEHLAEARAPAYVDLPCGRIGAISVTSHVNHAMDQVFGASARIGLSNGRPGANSLRVTRTICLPAEAWVGLRDFVTSHDYAFPGAFAVVPSVIIYEDRFKIGNDWYVKSDTPGYSYEAHPDDVQDILKSVANAAIYSNFTVCNMHTHQWNIDPLCPKGGLNGEVATPPDFLVRLAHDVIDAGADLFCTTGPFDFRAIEIFKGKPVFYGLGSFVRQAYMEEVLPWESYRPHQFGDASHAGVHPHATRTTDAELLFARAPKHPASYFESATANCIFRDGDLREIILYPIELGISGPASDLGTPKRASGARATKILEQISKNCEPFGTKVGIASDLGQIQVV